METFSSQHQIQPGQLETNQPTWALALEEMEATPSPHMVDVRLYLYLSTYLFVYGFICALKRAFILYIYIYR